MIRKYRYRLAKWMINRRWRRVRVVSALGMWLPFWIIPIGVSIYFTFFGDFIVLLLPVLVVGRYFVTRRTGDTVIQKIYDIVRLKHPLAQSLRKAGTFEPGLVGIRMETIGELLEEGTTLAESLRVALPEITANRVSAISLAESQNDLPAELERQTNRREMWNVFTELDTSMLVYFTVLVAITMLVAKGGRLLIVPKFKRFFADWHVAGFHTPPWPVSQFCHLPSFVGAFAAFLLPLMIGGILLRRLFVPFFRQAEWFLYCRDAVAWRLPVFGRMVRLKTWSDATQILADGYARGATLGECCERAAWGAGNLAARRRLKKWGRFMAQGNDPAESARRARLPKIICSAISMPGEMSAAGLQIAARQFEMDYRRIMAWVRAASIPLAVLVCGALVCEIALMLYFPYSQLLWALCRSAG
jgi:type II secretory pathway component PulF